MTDWPHAPVHRLSEMGAYMVTAATFRKEPFFATPQRLRLVHDTLLAVAARCGWHLQAWAVFANHYHWVAVPAAEPARLRDVVRSLHSVTARAINERDATPGRRVWYQYWDTLLTYETSYLARLNYVHQNAVHHSLVPVASRYPWCSAAWFERTAAQSFVRTVYALRTDRLSVMDDFGPDQSPR